jgi:hypothetical protein
MGFLARYCEMEGDSSAASSTALVATTVVTTLTLLSLARWALYPQRGLIIPGPLTTALPRLSKDELAKVPYQPDHFPGARDVATPVC